MNEPVRKRSEGSGLFVGLRMIALGVLFLLDRAGIGDFRDMMRRYRLMILVLIGVTQLFEQKIWGGLWFIALGAWFQMIRLGLFDLTFRDALPVALIILGGGMVVRALFDATRRREPDSPEQHR